MLVLLCVFQTVCFRSVYSKVRVNQVKKCASSIEENINSNNITTLVENLAEQNDVMIYVYDTTDSTVRPVYSTDKSFMKIMIYDSSSSSSNDSNSGSSSKSSGSSDKNSSDKKSSDNSSSDKNSYDNDIQTLVNECWYGNEYYNNAVFIDDINYDLQELVDRL